VWSRELFGGLNGGKMAVILPVLNESQIHTRYYEYSSIAFGPYFKLNISDRECTLSTSKTS
jgi:hypothetical protein